MTLIKRWLPAFAFILIPFFAQPPAACGVSFINTNSWMLETNQVHQEELWVYATNINVQGTLERDFFFLSDTVIFSGVGRQDVWGLAADVRLKGRCENDARLAGSQVRVSGRIDGNLTTLGNNISVSTNAILGGDLYALGKEVTVEGVIDGTVSLHAPKVSVRAVIKSDLYLEAMDIVILPGTIIHGNITYVSGKEIFLDKGVDLRGKLIRSKLPQPPSLTVVNRVVRQTAFLLAAVLLGIPLLLLFPKTTAVSLLLYRPAPLRSMFIGTLAFIGIPILAFLCGLTLIGIPLSVFLLLGYGLLLLAGKILSCLLIGTLLLKKANTPGHMSGTIAKLLAGLLAYYALTLLPGLGFFVWYFATVGGIGAIIQYIAADQHAKTELRIATEQQTH